MTSIETGVLAPGEKTSGGETGCGPAEDAERQGSLDAFKAESVGFPMGGT